MRPLTIDKVFNLSIDAITCLWGGLLVPKLCHDDIEAKFQNYNFLVSLASSVGEDTHIDKANYLNICKSDERTAEVGNMSLSMLAVFAFESIKSEDTYDLIKKDMTINFLRHLRNAGAHGNNFNFYNKGKLVDPGVVTWRNKNIDKSLQGKVAFPDFFKHGDFPYLLEDVSKVLAASTSVNP